MSLTKSVWANLKKNIFKNASSAEAKRAFCLKSNLVLLVTTRCNFNCKHCLRNNAGQAMDLSLEYAEKALCGAKKYNFYHVSLSGGEPLIYPYIKELVALIDTQGYTFSIVTNGYNFKSQSSWLEKYREKIAFVAFSLESIDKNKHDALRQEGSFEKLQEDFRICKSLKIPFRILTAVSSSNIDEIFDIALLAKKTGAQALVLTTVLPCPRAEDSKLVLEAKRREELFLLASGLSKIIKMPILTGADIHANNNLKICESIAMNGITIDAEGNFVLCCELSNYDNEEIRRRCIVTSLKDKPFEEAVKIFSEYLHRFICRRVDDYKNEPDPDTIDFNSCFYCLKKLKA